MAVFRWYTTKLVLWWPWPKYSCRLWYCLFIQLWKPSLLRIWGRLDRWALARLQHLLEFICLKRHRALVPGLLVFILSIGYYITPALVGGRSGQLISNFIAYHMKSSLNWGLAAALGTILLVAVLILYWLYNKIIGIDKMKLGWIIWLFLRM